MYSATSLLGNIWKLKDFDERHSLMLSQRYNISPLISKLLNIREVPEDQIDQFLNPKNIVSPLVPGKMKTYIYKNENKYS